MVSVVYLGDICYFCTAIEEKQNCGLCVQHLWLKPRVSIVLTLLMMTDTFLPLRIWGDGAQPSPLSS